MMTLIAVLHFAPQKWSFLSAVPHSFCGLVHISDNFIPIYPRFANGEIEFAMKLSSQDADYAGYVGGTVEIYFLVGEE